MVSRIVPNQGIQLSARNALVVALLTVAILGLLAGMLMLLWPKIGMGFAKMALGMGGLMWLWYGGLDLLYHGTLRAILWWNDYMPLNVVRFLDHAAAQIFLRKVGGGYTFVHQLLQDYFVTHAR